MNDVCFALDFWCEYEVNIKSDMTPIISQWCTFQQSNLLKTFFFYLQELQEMAFCVDGYLRLQYSKYLSEQKVACNGYEWWSWCVRLLI